MQQQLYAQRQYHIEENIDKNSVYDAYLMTHHIPLGQQDDMLQMIHMYMTDILYKVYASRGVPFERNMLLDVDLLAVKKYLLTKIRAIDIYTYPRYILNAYMAEYIKQQEQDCMHRLSYMAVLPSGIQYAYSEVSTAQVRKCFIELYEQGLVQEQKNVMPWSIENQLIIPEDELVYQKTTETMWYIRYFIDTKKDVVVVPTTAPETLFGDVALAVNPLDKRYKKIVGKYVIIPIINKTIPIVADEAVDMTKHTGVCRVTPGHDVFGLEVAKRHGLSLDIHAIDQYGYFTDRAGVFAGKNVLQFRENVIQYLDDIANVDSTQEVEHDVAYVKKTGERIHYISMKQRFFDVTRFVHQLDQMLEQGVWSVIPPTIREQIQSICRSQKFWCVSRKMPFGALLPVRYTQGGQPYIFDVRTLVSTYTKTKKKEKFGFEIAYIVLQCIYDGRIPSVFGLEHLVDVLFGPSLDPTHEIALTAYIEMIEEDYPNMIDPFVLDVLRSCITTFHQDSMQMDVLVEKIEGILERGFGIVRLEDLYTLDVRVWGVDIAENITICDSTYDNHFVYMAHIYAMLQQGKKKFFSYAEQQKITSRLTKVLVFLTAQGGETVHNNIHTYSLWDYITTSQCTIKDPKIQNTNDLMHAYPSDAIRYAILQAYHEPNISLDQHIIVQTALVNKLWNAIRYIFSSSIGSIPKTGFNPSAIITDCLKHWDEFNEFDKWILFQLHALQDTIQLPYINYTSLAMSEKIKKFCFEDFCESYIEIGKLSHSEYTGKILLYVGSQVLYLMYPYMPFVSWQLWQQMGLHETVVQGGVDIVMEGYSKNYKVHLCMNIIDSYRSLRDKLAIPKHQSVDLYIQASSDFLHFMKEYESCMHKLLHTHSIEYIRAGMPEPIGYTTTNVIDITLGLKLGQQIEHTVSSQELEKMLAQKKEYMQYMRGLMIAHPHASKHEEMEDLKKQIDQLEYEIAKRKMKTK